MGVKLIHEVHDIWPETLTTIGGMSEKHPFVKVLQIAENSSYKNSDKVVSMAPFAIQHMMEHGLSEDKFVYIPNGIDHSEWKSWQEIPEKHRKVFDQLKSKNKFIVGYFGGHALSNNLMVLIDVAESLKEFEDIVFVLVGDGVEKERLKECARNKSLKNVLFLTPVSKRQIPALLLRFDCVFIGGKDSPLYKYGINMNKMFDAMMGAKPIILAMNVKHTPIETYQCGCVVGAEDVNAIKTGIINLMQMSEQERKKMGERGRAAILEHYDYQILAKKFEEVWS